MRISLPETLRQWVEERVAAQGYGTASEYIRTLVREDQKRKARKALDDKLCEAVESGDAVEMTSRDWQRIRKAVRSRLNTKAGTAK